jgi:nitrate reductase gamma subunit
LTIAAYLAIYAGLLIFLAGCLRRILIYARAPLHLRWELYPVPHEDPKRAEHGGSCFESTDDRQKPQVFHHLREWAVMFKEIAFLNSLREANPRLWIPSFLFHGGLYLSIASLILLMAAVLPGMLFAGSQIALLSSTLLPSAAWIGFAGEILVLIGALLLLMRRMSDTTLKNYTKAGDIFNLLFFLAAFAFLSAGSFIDGPNAASAGAVARGIFSFDRATKIGNVLGTGLILTAALAAWIPFTHMAHFIAKYFTWHSVRWDDRRMERGSAIEAKVSAYLNYHPTWAALHLGANGKKSWAEIAAAAPPKEVRK